MEQPSYTLEKCEAGGWNAQFDTDDFDTVADRIRDNVDLDVDTEHMLLWHMDDVKISFTRSSGIMTVRTEDKAAVEHIVKTVTT